MSTCPSIEPICLSKSSICLLLLLYLHIISPILQNVHLSILFVCPPVPPYGLYIDPSFHIFKMSTCPSCLPYVHLSFYITHMSLFIYSKCPPVLAYCPYVYLSLHIYNTYTCLSNLCMQYYYSLEPPLPNCCSILDFPAVKPPDFVSQQWFDHSRIDLYQSWIHIHTVSHIHLVLHHQSNYQEHYQGCPG